jgi:hypothetical protein
MDAHKFVDVIIRGKYSDVITTINEYPQFINKPNQFGRFPLSASSDRFTQIFSDRTLDGNRKVRDAVAKEAYGIFELLLNKGADPNLPPSLLYGSIPVFTQHHLLSFEILKLLLSRPDIDVNKESYKETPLLRAIAKNVTVAATMLINHPNINLELAPSMDKTPLMFAAENGNVEVVKALLNKRAIANNVDLWKKTPIMYAIYGNDGDRGYFPVGNKISVLKLIMTSYEKPTIPKEIRLDALPRELREFIKGNKEFNLSKTELVGLSKGLPDPLISLIKRFQFGKKPTNTQSLKSLKARAKKLGIRLTLTRNGKRVPKSEDLLAKQIRNKHK